MATPTLGATPPVQPRPPIQAVTRPFRRFTRIEASSGLLLLAAAGVALIWANSPYADAYEALWATPLTVGLGTLELEKPLLLWINDGLMALFFLVVGLELKRELLFGELRAVRRAVLPATAAVGGMLAPALVYFAVQGSGPYARAWGVPMATDIAFALGILALVGSRVPVGLKVFLTTLAIVDDLGAVLVIALFYTTELHLAALAVASVLFAGLLTVGALGTRSVAPFAVIGVLLWLAVLLSGVHATVAGALIAFAVPLSARRTPVEVVAAGRRLLAEIDLGDVSAIRRELRDLEQSAGEARSPLEHMEEALHPWTAYAILPLFALANAGVVLGDVGAALDHPVTLAVALGLMLGNPIGIVGCTWLAARSGVAELPDGVSWRHVLGMSSLAGVGFTMSIFIATLAFGPGPLLDNAKVGILLGSVVSGVLGYVILRTAPACAPAKRQAEGSD